jgi:hypothetical protein
LFADIKLNAAQEKTKHKYGDGVIIIDFDSKTSVGTVNYEALDLLLLNPEVKDRKIVTVSIVGAFRKGKSFYMDYCLRFMYANVSRNKCA